MFEKLFGSQYSKFRLGQLLFLTAVTFGLFAGDVIRIILAVFALFCLGHENFKFNWCREQKITGIVLAVFCAWMIIIPVIFGENPLPVRLRSAVRPVELTIWIAAVLLFAKDTFFLRNLKRMSITACAVYAVIALVWCFKTKFLLGADSWPVLRAAYSVAALMAGLSAWLMHDIATAENRRKRIISFIILLFAISLVILPRYSTFWLALPLSVFAALVMLLAKDRRGLARVLTCLVIACFIACSAIYAGMQKSPSLQKAVKLEIEQLSAYNDENFSIKQFSNHRDQIWLDAVTAIKQKPIFGFGRDAFENHSHKIYAYYKTFPPHAHNSWFQAAFEGGIPLAILFTAAVLMIFLLAFRSLHCAEKLLPLPFVTIIVLTQFLIAGLVENFYLTNRSILVFYWSIFISMLSLYNSQDGEAQH